MQAGLPNIPVVSHAKRVIATLREHRHQAYLAGGCVRDALLGRTPIDYDVATSATPDQVQALFKKTSPVGKQFGVVIVAGDVSGVAVEVATFRRDGNYTDGRRPDDVTYGEIDDDAKRRDFTINALFMDPFSMDVVDLVDGVRDLKARMVRAVGDADARIDEDKLRMLRAVRFACALNFELDDATETAITHHASEISQCSMERILHELTRMLTDAGRGRAVRLLASTGLLDFVLPDVATLPPENFATATASLEMLPDPTPSLAFAALLFDAGAEAAREAVTRLKSSRQIRDETETMIRIGNALDDLHERSIAEQKRLLRDPLAEPALILMRARCLNGRGDIERVTDAARARTVWQREGALFPETFLDGRDVIALGVVAGPRVSELLYALEDEALEGRIESRVDAEGFLKRCLDEHGR